MNDYLDGVEAYIDCTYKQINFATHLRDLNGCDSYYYDDENYSLDREEGLLIRDCVNNGKIQLMNIPIISESDENDFLKAYEVLEDYEEALGKIGCFESINVWAREEEITGYALYVEESSASIIGEKAVIANESNMVLPYNESCVVSGNYRWERTDLCYVKNVLLSGLKISVPYLVDGVVLKGAVINIKNPEFVPNVSRNNISTLQQTKLSYAIGKAIHMWIRDNVSLTSEQKGLLDLFIESKYSMANYCLK